MESRYSTLEEIHTAIIPLVTLNKRALQKQADILLELYLSFVQAVKGMTRQYAVKYGFDDRLKAVHINFQGRHKLGLGHWNYRSYLGCCSCAGIIRINPAIILMHPNKIRETILHELCHLEIFEHSKMFYELLDNLMLREQAGKDFDTSPLIDGSDSEKFMKIVKDIYDTHKRQKQKEEKSAVRTYTK